MKELLLGPSHGRLGIQYKHEDIGIQAMIVDPVVQIGRNIDSRRVHKDHVVPQQVTAFPWPEYSHQAALAQLLLAQSVGQLLDILKPKAQNDRSSNSIAARPDPDPDKAKPTNANTYRHIQLLTGALGNEVSLGAVAALHLTETVGGMADAAGQNLLPQHGIDDRALAIRGASEEGHLHMIPGQYLANTRYLKDIALEQFVFGLVDDVRLLVKYCVHPSMNDDDGQFTIQRNVPSALQESWQ